MRGLFVFTVVSLFVLGLSTADRAVAGDVDAGKAAFERLKCAKCHGDDGKGSGPTAQKLKAKGKDIKMHDWTDKAFMSKLTDDYLNEITHKGGKAIGKSRRMPSYAKKLKDGDLDNLLAFVRSFTKDMTASH